MLWRRSGSLVGSLALVGCVMIGGGMAEAAEWGTLKGRFVVEGSVPPAAALKIDKDESACSKGQLDRSLVVGPQGELADAVVWVREKGITVNPEYAKTAKTPVVLDNKGCMFEPHILILRTGQPLLLKNSDSVSHNTKADLLKNEKESFNDLIPANAEMEKTRLSEEESFPLPVSCSIHPWMTAKILIRGNPYAAVSKSDGSFEIKDLPAGEPIEFQFWQEKSGNLKGIQGAGLTADSKGRAKLTIKPGVNDLGDIKVPAALFAGK